MTPEQRTVWKMKQSGMTARQIADELGITVEAVKSRWKRAKRWARLDPDVQNRLKDQRNLTNLDGLRGFWDVRQDEDGGRTSLYYNLGADDEISLETIVTEAIEDRLGDKAPTFPKRSQPTGENLLVVDIADLHVGKLSVKSETGFAYTREVARHRIIEGTRALLRHAETHGVGRILYVLGNDLVHIDKPNRPTTSGTPQDTDGSIHEMLSDAEAAVMDSIELCAEVADVDIVFVPSNHDWIIGFGIARTIAAWFGNHPHVHTSDYNLCERHRKYYRYEKNIIGLTHGDGAKHSDLYPLMVTEARDHISECPHLYWYLHHIHHKDRQTVGRRPEKREKDLTGMTVIGSGTGATEGDNAQIEYVRSPSPPDGWHDRNGYVNRQAVECFLHHPLNGQFARYTEWF